MQNKVWLALAALSLVWGGSFLFIEIALEGVGPMTLVWGRVTLAAVVLAAVTKAGGHAWPRGGRTWLAYAVMGMLSTALPFYAISWGQQFITAGEASILTATVPMATVLLAVLFNADENLSRRRVIGVMLGFVGVVVLMAPAVGAGQLDASLGHLAVVGAAWCYAGAALFGKRFSKTTLVVNSTATLVCAAVMLTPLTFVLESPFAAVPPVKSVLAIVAMALLSTAAAYLVYFWVLRTAGATQLVLVTYLIPVSSVTLAAIFLGERVNLASLLGVAGIFLGLAVMDGRLLRLLFKFRQRISRSEPRVRQG